MRVLDDEIIASSGWFKFNEIFTAQGARVEPDCNSIGMQPCIELCSMSDEQIKKTYESRHESIDRFTGASHDCSFNWARYGIMVRARMMMYKKQLV